MALLDGDRFEGRFRDGVHYADTGDMMRRLTKEELLKFAYQLRKIDPRVRNDLTKLLMQDRLVQGGCSALYEIIMMNDWQNQKMEINRKQGGLQLRLSSGANLNYN